MHTAFTGYQVPLSGFALSHYLVYNAQELGTLRKLRHREFQLAVRALDRSLIQFSSKERRLQEVEVATDWQTHGRCP